MGFLTYKTNGMASPQGKPRVYFCCHPEDFRYFFGPISDELLQYQKNCAVWYPVDPAFDRSDPEHLADLEQMQLFVMPVTARLLSTENPALDIEFAFAMEHHIPVLPLMQEQGLEELFNRQCGDLQFLDKHAQDDTAIRYEDKLEKFLSSVLIGDELAEKIRAAFDAYVFLSYRKKDRRYAQELMRLIHQNDFCRDIAIWYDEFLTPGENFNESIRAALEKSGLFVLAVTPNLVNEQNYIMTTEYPMAQECGKPILPVEMLPTDQAALAEKYEDIPTPTAAHDRPALSEALLAAVKQMVMAEHGGTPEHRFFIGLAYLGGVDVEVDLDRALSLISSAAEAGLPEACEQLVKMYRTGHGVERNYQTAIEWQHKKIALLQAAFDQAPDEERGYALVWALIRAGDLHRELKQTAAKQPYTEALSLAKRLTKQYGERLFGRELSVCYARLGHVCKAEGDHVAAQTYYDDSLRIAERLAKDIGSVEAQRDLSIAYEDLGNIAKAQGDLAAAEAYFQKAFRIVVIWLAETDSAETRRDLAICHHNLGSVAQARGRFEDAKKHYEQQLDLCERLAQETGTAEARRDLAISYSDLGNLAMAEDDLNAAGEHYRKCLDMMKQLAEETGALEARRDLAFAYDNLGDVACAKGGGNRLSARSHYVQALKIRQILAEEIDTLEVQGDLADSYENLGSVAKADEDWASAERLYQKALPIRRQLADTIGTLKAQRDLLHCYLNLGDVAHSHADSKQYYEQGLRLAERLAEENGTPTAKSDLSHCYHQLSYIAEEEKDPAAAADYAQKSVRLREWLAQELGTSAAKGALADGYERLGAIVAGERRFSVAKKHYKKCLHIREQLANETDDATSQRNLAAVCNRLGDVAVAQKRFAKAKTYYQRSVDIHERLVSETLLPEAQYDLTVCYNKQGDVAKNERDFATAKHYYERSLRIRQQLAEIYDTAQNRERLALVYRKLAEVDGEHRHRHLREAERLYEGLCREYPQVKRYSKRLALVRSLLQE